MSRLRNLSLRGRLTIFGALLFLAAGVLILAGIYLVLQRQLEVELSSAETDARISALQQEAERQGGSTITMPDGSTVKLDEIIASLRADRTAIKDVALNSLLTQGAIVVLTVAAAAGAGGWIIAGRGLRPLDVMTDTAERIARSTGPGRDLHERIALTGPEDEVKRLADTFDTMLESLDRAFDGQRRFTAHASHQLRTPLAVERALIELETTRRGASPDLIELGRRLLDINTANTRLIDGLLILADSEHHLDNPVPTDLKDVADKATAAVEPVAAPGLTVHRDLATAPCLGDPVLLEQLAVNLIENALRHNVPNGNVTIATGTHNGHAFLRVDNTGPTVAAEDIPDLFEPFHRGTHSPDRDRDGFGLGLAIVKAITTAHRGTLDAHPNDPGGLTITVALDKHQQEPTSVPGVSFVCHAPATIRAPRHDVFRDNPSTATPKTQ